MMKMSEMDLLVSAFHTDIIRNHIMMLSHTCSEEEGHLCKCWVLKIISSNYKSSNILLPDLNHNI